MRCPVHHRPGVVEAVDAHLDVGGEQVRQRHRGEGESPRGGGVVLGRVQPRGGDHVHAGGAADLGQLRHVAARRTRHGIDHRPHPRLAAAPHLSRRVLRRWQEDVGESVLDQRMVDDQVLVQVGGAQVARVDVAEDGADRAHSSRMAPSARSRSCTRPGATSRTSPPFSTARAAATPAAWPIAMHWAIERIEAWASWVAEKHLPATSVLTESRTTSDRSGMPTAWPSGRYTQVVPVPSPAVEPWWSSIGAPHRPTWSSDWVAESTSSRVTRWSPYTRRVSRKPIPVLIATRSACSYPGTLSFKNRTYSSTWRRPSISARVRTSGSVAFITRPS